MSPFSQLGFHRGYDGSIDRNFNPILHYIDQIDCHFSNHHNWMNYFIPRFDLEEDDRFYYLSGEFPGAKAEDIIIEAQDGHTLVIYGSTHSHSLIPVSSRAEENQSDDNEHPAPRPTRIPSSGNTKDTKAGPSGVDHLSTITSYSRHPHSFSPPDHVRHSKSGSKNGSHQPSRILISERLVGSFHRTFTFSKSVREEGITTSLKDGLLSLQIPKEELKTADKVKRIPIVERN
jgi:HSP20 family protein